MPPPSSVVAWRGPSAFDGSPVQVVLTGLEVPSTNDKTGPMVQAYILPVGEHPVVAAREGRDVGICGSCPARRSVEGWCYVTPLSLLSLGKALQTNRVPVRATQARELVEGKELRVGAYGDPAAVPYAFWRGLLEGAAAWTGYTHAWDRCDPRFSSICMASCQDHRGATRALARGWRYFRAKPAGSPTLPSEVACPADTRGVKCIDCLLCCGTELRAKNVTIDIHGFAASAFRQPSFI